jgi:hypothetical protein
MYLHMKRTRGGSSCSKLQKLDGSVLSGPTAVRGTVRLRRGSPPLVKRHLGGGEA